MCATLDLIDTPKFSLSGNWLRAKKFMYFLIINPKQLVIMKHRRQANKSGQQKTLMIKSNNIWSCYE